MCGIVGYVGERDAVPLLLEGLKSLEYRGYDSAGLGVIQDGKLQVRRSAGKIERLADLLGREPLRGTVGVAHTRWATHGPPSAANAHPHLDCRSSLAVVHNGIIENHRVLKDDLAARGHVFLSQTDTEVVAHLLESSDEDRPPEEVALEAVSRMRGAFALGVLGERHPDRLIALRHGGPPLVLGLSEHGTFLASDVAALLAFTRDVVLLEDGELAVLGAGEPRIVSFGGRPVSRKGLRVQWDAAAAEKGGFRHFMLKEIHEQPRAIADTFRGRIAVPEGVVDLPEVGLAPGVLPRLSRAVLVACGTSWHAALVGKHLLERVGGLPVEVDVASEFRYRPPLVGPDCLTVAISQSGETADTLGALREARRLGSPALAICNVVGSTLAREADGVLYTRAGPEIGVASTKAFTTQLVALYLLAAHLGRARGRISAADARRLLEDLERAPGLAAEAVERCSGVVEELARRFFRCPSFLYLGRGPSHAIALEGALKLKEISYIHAEGYAAGEMKHGPIALIEPGVPVVVLALSDRFHGKTLGNVEEVKARGGTVIAVATDGDEEIPPRADYVLWLPRGPELLEPILAVLPLQLLAYHVAVLRGCDVDQPRNLAKSVTVE